MTKKVVHFCMQLGYLDKDPFIQHKTAFIQFSRDYLTQDELSRIENHNFRRIKRLDRVKDVFLFVCYTGLSYSDLFELSPEGITKGIDRKNWVIYEREKAGVRASIPILPPAQAIIDKYKDDPECLIQNKLIPVIRHLCIVKGNYLPEEFKSESIATRFNDRMLFENLSYGVPFEQLKIDPKTQNYYIVNPAKNRTINIKKLNPELSVREIAEKLNSEGFNIGKTRVWEWIKQMDTDKVSAI